MSRGVEKTALQAASLFGLILCVLTGIWAWQAGLLTSQDRLQAFVASCGAAGGLLFVAFQMVQVVVPVLPGGLGCLVGVVLFGPVMGFVYNYVGICIGSLLAFAVARNCGRPLLSLLFSEKLIAKYSDWTERNNRFARLFALAIFFPVAPDDFLCYLAGTTSMTWRRFTAIILLGIYLWHRSNKFGAVVFTIVFLAIQVLFFAASMAKFLHGGWFTLLLTLAILMIMYTWNEGTKLERSQRRHMMPKDFLPALDKLHGDSRIHRFADNIVYLTSDPDLKRLDTDIFFSIFADHPKRARAWWAVAVETTDEPFTREYSVESFGTDYLFRVRIRLGFKVSQSIPAYLHQIMHDLEKTGELPNQQSIYPKLDADPGIGTIRYVVIHKALMPESKVSGRGALSLQIKYAIRRVAGSPVKWFGLAPYNPLVEVQPLFVSTRRPPRLTRVASQAPKREG